VLSSKLKCLVCASQKLAAALMGGSEPGVDQRHCVLLH